MKTREERFFGSGNFTLEDGRRRGWRIQCQHCTNVSVVSIPKPLPPDVIIKKFRQRGWIVGAKSQEDICDECRSRQSPAQNVNDGSSSHDRVEKFQQKYDNATLQTKINELNKELKRAKEALGYADKLVDRYKVDHERNTQEHHNLLRHLHELLINENVEAALQKIEDQNPKWPWAKRPSKIKGSARIPKQQVVVADTKFDQWIDQLEKDHLNRQAS